MRCPWTEKGPSPSPTTALRRVATRWRPLALPSTSSATARTDPWPWCTRTYRATTSPRCSSSSRPIRARTSERASSRSPPLDRSTSRSSPPPRSRSDGRRPPSCGCVPRRSGLGAHLFSLEATGPDAEKWSAEAAQDWEAFLRHRSVELRPGGQVVVSTLIADRSLLPWMEIVDAGAMEAVEAGVLRRDELERMVVPTYLRTHGRNGGPDRARRLRPRAARPAGHEGRRPGIHSIR